MKMLICAVPPSCSPTFSATAKSLPFGAFAMAVTRRLFVSLVFKSIETKAMVTIPIERDLKIKRNEQNELPPPSIIDPRVPSNGKENVGGVVLDSVSYLKFLEVLNPV